MGHGCIIIFMINGTQVKIGFQGSESVFYFSDCVVNIPYNYFVLHIEIGTQKIDTQVICLVVMLCFIFLPANICCPLRCFILAYLYVVILFQSAVQTGSSYQFLSMLLFGFSLPGNSRYFLW